jgi:ABC-type amino acid transport substrate-binding protein
MERQRMTTRYLICAGLVFISSLGWSESKDVITVAGFEIPGVMEPKLTGSYDQILVEVFSHLPSKVKYFVIPTARADSLFSDNAVDCVAPMDIRYSKIQEMVVNSKPINIAKIYIYSRNKEGPWTTLQDIEGKRVGIKNGLWYGPKWSDKKMHVEAVASDEQNIEKLKKGRIDAFLAYVPDMTVLKHDKGIILPNHDPKRPFDIHNDSLLCHKSKRIEKMLKEFDQAISTMRTNGRLKQMLGISFVE